MPEVWPSSDRRVTFLHAGATNIAPRGVAGVEQGARIEVICDAHLTRDPVGPFITLLDGRWAYCAANAADGHRWRRRAAIGRDLLEALPDQVRLICDDERHLQQGRVIPDGDGMLTFAEGKWAYCTASRDEPHHWVTVEPTELQHIHHDEVADRFEGRP